MHQVIGTIRVINSVQKVSETTKKREFVIIIPGNGPTDKDQYITFWCYNDKVTILDQFKMGDVVDVNFNIRGREWNGPRGIKYFTTLEAWRIVKK